MTRRDGRPLVTEFPVTAEDRIDVLHDVEIPEGELACRLMREVDDGFDEGEWYA